MITWTHEQYLEIENLKKQIKQASVALFKKSLELNDKENGFHVFIEHSGHVNSVNIHLQLNHFNYDPSPDPIEISRFYLDTWDFLTPELMIQKLNENLGTAKQALKSLINHHKKWRKEINHDKT